ncbi:hypothetical protein LCGC14_2743610 [marine sediment metagenome]|uniref:Uncharacterized protein n=1 Tax=marine sediment metagenome TaxID=412755 RepID=A0A0F8ZR08_9ZZZZ
MQHLHITSTKPHKKFTISKLQRKILRELNNGQYLKRNYTRWILVNPKVSWGHGVYKSESVSSISVDSLFQKGLLRDLVTADMSDLEIEMQTALGSIPKLKAFTINKEAIKTLGLCL